MDMQDYIAIEMICRHHNAEVTFITGLQEYGLVEVIQVNNEPCIPISSLPEIEKVLRLRNDLNINEEGIDVIFGLLQKMKEMHHEMELLKSRLRLYEDM